MSARMFRLSQLGLVSRFIAFAMLVSLLSGCKLGETTPDFKSVAKENPPSGPRNDRRDNCTVPASTPPKCHEDVHEQPADGITKKIDLLFVSAVVGSFDLQKEKIADRLLDLMAELPSGSDVRIAVMGGYGPGSPEAGKLVKAKNEAIVLDPSLMDEEELEYWLLRKLVAGNDEAENGRHLLYSLQKGVEGQALSQSRKQGFFREDAALAVVFLSDSDDFCSSSSGRSAADCAGISANSVISKLRKVQKERPLLVTGISRVKTVGTRISELVETTGGVRASFSEIEDGNGLPLIGTFLHRGMSVRTEFELPRFQQQMNQMDQSSLRVSVDGAEVPSQLLVDEARVRLTDYAGVSRSRVALRYCERAKENTQIVICPGDGRMKDPQPDQP